MYSSFIFTLFTNEFRHMLRILEQERWRQETETGSCINNYICKCYVSFIFRLLTNQIVQKILRLMRHDGADDRIDTEGITKLEPAKYYTLITGYYVKHVCYYVKHACGCWSLWLIKLIKSLSLRRINVKYSSEINLQIL